MSQREGVVVPEVLRAPGAAGGDPGPGRAAEDAVFGVHRPAPRVKRGLGLLRADAADRPEPIGIRLETLAQVRLVRRPVVHLHVDVGVVVAPPRRMVAVVPLALQIGRQPARPRGGNQQVAAILEEQCFQAVIGTLGFEVREALVGGEFLLGRVGAEIEGDAVELQPMMRNSVQVIETGYRYVRFGHVAKRVVIAACGRCTSPASSRSRAKSVPASTSKS